MARLVGQDRTFGGRPLSVSGGTAISTGDSDVLTTPGERFLLFVIILIYPLEAHVRIIPNVSTMFILFSVLAAYVAINRLHCLDMVWMHPVFVAAYLFIGISVALEFASPLSSYVHIMSFAFMIVGALLVASLCRDRAALKMLMYGYIGAALWLGVFIVLASYGTLSGIVATDYTEASLARAEAFKDASIKGDLNGLAHHCVQGGVVALAFALGNASVRGRNFFATIAIFCLVASSLPMSRGAIVMALVSCAVVLKTSGLQQRKRLLAGLIAIGAALLVPNAIWSRMAIMTAEGRKDARVSFYESALQHVDDYWFMGVGEGNFYQKWGFDNGFAHVNGDVYAVYGVHNSFLQIMINWGIISLLAFIAVIWLAYRCLPRMAGKNVLELGILGIALTMLVLLPFVSEFYWKGFSLGLGMLVAYKQWLKPIAAH